MKHRHFHIVLCLLLSTGAFAQERTLINFQLRAYLQRTEPSTMVDLFLQGDAASVAGVAMKHGGVVKMATRHWVSVRMPAARIEELNAEQDVRSIEFTLSRGHTMNDSMRYKTRIDLVQQGHAPLLQPYDGEGVIMGLIDTGVDFTHPDFLDSLGNTRVLKYWDQTYAYDAVLTPQPYGYGQAWDSTMINAGTCPAVDHDGGGHGTTVTGTAAGNGGHDHRFIGAAPKSDIIMVSTDFNHADWNSTVVDGIKYIFDEAAALGRPAVVNLSLGDYYGSHDGLDPATLMIDDMLAAPGRSVVCAAGNSGAIGSYHLHTDITSDTTFTWFRYHATNNTVLGMPCVYFDLWSDTADFSQVSYSIAGDRKTGGYVYRGRIPFRNIQGTIGVQVTDTLKSFSGNRLGIVSTFASVRGGQYHLEVAIPQPDSADNYYYRFITTGSGQFDAWSYAPFGTSQIINANLPTATQFPPITQYVLPDASHTIVDAWACSPHVLTVGNYNNEQTYTAANDSVVVLGNTEGQISVGSSRGPSRTGLLKPDVASPGDVTFSAGPLYLIAIWLTQANNVVKVATDSLHVRAGGTSIASPSVAGAAALYLQRCPLASADEVRDAINATAFGDGFTGTLPNNTWGHGKLDAFNLMIGRIHLVGDTVFCSADSVMIDSPGAYSTYQWTTGSTDPFTYVHGDPLSLMAVNYSGCAMASDTMHFNVLPSPAAPVITAGTLLDAGVGGVTYQWFRYGDPISGANSQTYNVTSTGDYYVVVTAPDGCTASSNTAQVLFTSIGVNASAGLRVWPSPASDALFVEIPKSDASSVKDIAVIDARGAVVPCAWSKSEEWITVQVRPLATGLYTLRFNAGSTSNVVRFAKQ